MGQVSYTRFRGETLLFAVLDPDAAPGDEAKIGAALGLLDQGVRSLPAGAATKVALAVAYRAATAEVPPGWTLSLDAEASAALEAGRHYQLDVRRTDGAVVSGGNGASALVQIREPAFQ